MVIRILNLLTVLTCLQGVAMGQTLPIGSPQEELYRRQQLAGKLDPAISFSVRPILAESGKDNFYADSVHFFNSRGMLRLLPVSWKQQFNSHHPYGWNDGAIIPAKGYQTLLNAGVYAKLGPLTIQLQPEFVYAVNNSFDGFALGKTNTQLNGYYGFYNNIDVPESFGNKSYKKAFWGQSSIRLNFGPASVGFSTENIWWGPGIQNSLLMTNNAPGFNHFTLNTARPVKTPIGTFEGQVIGGKLEGSGFSPLLQTHNSAGVNLFVPPNKDWRYLAGLNINYQPKWVPGLFIGFSRTFMAYHTDVHGFWDYFPFFVKLQKFDGDQDEFDRDQRIDLYVRWLFQKAHAEVYFEYGINDNAYNFRDFLGSPDHCRAYLFGLNKLVPLDRLDEYIQVNAEVTQLSQSIDRLVRRAAGFYQHSGVRQGYTHAGQVLGAGSGTGGNLQTLQLSWTRGLKSVGFKIERLEHNMDFYDFSIKDMNGLSRKWVDFAVGFQGQWDYQHFIFNAKLQGIKSLNYQWLLKDYTPGQYYIPHNDVFNFHGELGIIYNF